MQFSGWCICLMISFMFSQYIHVIITYSIGVIVLRRCVDVAGVTTPSGLPWQDAGTWFGTACNCIRADAASIPEPSRVVRLSHSSDENLCRKAVAKECRWLFLAALHLESTYRIYAVACNNTCYAGALQYFVTDFIGSNCSRYFLMGYNALKPINLFPNEAIDVAQNWPL